MFSRIHERLGTAGFVISIVALIAALTGGAYAASALSPQVKKQITKESKKFSKKFSKQFAKPGATGATGATGAPGAKGDAGANGANGTPGSPGSPGQPGEAGMCSQANPECALPAGGTLTGTWSASGGGDDYAFATISFPLRVSPPPTAILEDRSSGFGRLGFELKDGEVNFVGPHKTLKEIIETGDLVKAFKEDEDAFLAICPGTAAEPAAEPGFLCIYEDDRNGDVVPPNGENVDQFAEAATEFGVTVPFETNENPGFIRGTWAVTN